MAPEVERVLAGALVSRAVALEAADACEPVLDDDSSAKMLSSVLSRSASLEFAMQALMGVDSDRATSLGISASRS